MALEEYEKTLARFQLEKLNTKVDLRLNKNGNIEKTRDGDLQFGNTQMNAMFRLVERWRHSESTINELFFPMLRAVKQLENLEKERKQGTSPSLSQDPIAYHRATEAIIEYQSVSSVLAGSIFVVANNLLQRFRMDLNASWDEWKSAIPKINNFSIGEIYSAAAANFRHYDEWAISKKPDQKQLPSMTVLCGLLDYPVQTKHGFSTIRTNVCGSILMMVSEGSIDGFHQKTFDYVKALAKYQ